MAGFNSGMHAPPRPTEICKSCGVEQDKVDFNLKLANGTSGKLFVWESVDLLRFLAPRAKCSAPYIRRSIARVTPVKSTVGIFPHQGHISQVGPNVLSVSLSLSQTHGCDILHLWLQLYLFEDWYDFSLTFKLRHNFRLFLSYLSRGKYKRNNITLLPSTLQIPFEYTEIIFQNFAGIVSYSPFPCSHPLYLTALVDRNKMKFS